MSHEIDTEIPEDAIDQLLTSDEYLAVMARLISESGVMERFFERNHARICENITKNNALLQRLGEVK